MTRPIIKSFRLSLEQNEKLIEMCTKLYPERKWKIEGYHENCRLIMITPHENLLRNRLPLRIDEKIGMNYMTGTIIDSDVDCFHWFEFCMTHLLDKISLMYDDFAYKLVKGGKINYLDGTIATGLQIGVIKGENPIDILYKYFKKN